jgi:hypothetical protein
VIRTARTRPAIAVLAALSVVAGVVIMAKARGTTFYYDEWNFVLDRRGWDLDTFLQPHNEHFSLVPILLYKLMFGIAGLDHYGAYRLAILLVHLTIVALLFALVGRRIGDWPALALCLPLLFLGSGWLDILWPFQLGFLISIAAALGAMLAVERKDRAGDAAACALLVVAICSSSLGVAIAIAVGASILFQPDRRERAWIFVVPLAIYALWYLGYGRSAARASNIDDIPRYVGDAAAGAMSAVSGLGTGLGRVLAVVLAIGVAGQFLNRARFSPRLVMLTAMPLVFWVLTALARAQLHEPASPRYLYPGAVFVLLLLAYLLETVRLRVAAVALLLIAAAGSAAANVGDLGKGGNHLRDAAKTIKADLAAVELAGPRVEPTVLTDLVVNPGQPQIKAGKYLEAIRDLGSSPALTLDGLLRTSPAAREEADRVLLTIYARGFLAGGRALPGQRPRVNALQGARLSGTRSCIKLAPEREPVLADLTVPAGGLVISSLQGHAPVEVRLKRFADAFPGVPVGTTSSGLGLLRFPKDSSSRLWQVQLTSFGPFEACGTRPQPG